MTTSTILTICAIIVLLLVLSAFFSGSETALTAASRGKLKSKAEKGSKSAALALKITDNTEALIGSILLGNNLVNILSASLATTLFTVLYGENGVFFATIVMTFLVLIFAEVLPKTIAIANSEKVASKVARPIYIVIFLFAPIVVFIRLLVGFFLSPFGLKADPNSKILAVREEIAGAVTLGHQEGLVEKEDRDRILGALELSNRSVSEIMLHRSNIEMIDVNLPPQEALSKCLSSPHTRLPVYRDNPENIIGVLHAKDLARAMDKLTHNTKDPAQQIKNFRIEDVAMTPYFIPETTSLDDQMREFLRRRTHFALIVDEYGALQGLLTLEDILEEIVGEITDEFDNMEQEILPTGDGEISIDGAITIRDLNRAQDWSLPDDEAVTVAGLIIHEAQMIPTQGQVFVFHGFRFEIVSRKENKLERIKITQLR